MKRATKFDNRAHKINYKRWHKCAKCRVFVLFNDEPVKTMYVCPECWELWKDLPQYRVTKLIPRVPEKVDWPIEHMLLYLAACTLCLLVIAFYLLVK